MIKINKDICPQDHRCPAIKICPVDAISQNEFDLPIIDNEKCIECKKCIQYCPLKAIYIV